jgi:hypothetical protein
VGKRSRFSELICKLLGHDKEPPLWSKFPDDAEYFKRVVCLRCGLVFSEIPLSEVPCSDVKKDQFWL